LLQKVTMSYGLVDQMAVARISPPPNQLYLPSDLSKEVNGSIGCLLSGDSSFAQHQNIELGINYVMDVINDHIVTAFTPSGGNHFFSNDFNIIRISGFIDNNTSKGEMFNHHISSNRAFHFPICRVFLGGVERRWLCIRR